MNHPATGGYFELELPAAASDYHAGALRLQSARAALLLLLQQGKPSAVWLPWYLCQSMLGLRSAAMRSMHSCNRPSCHNWPAVNGCCM